MRFRSKRYRAVAEKAPREPTPIDQAVVLVKQMASAKFTESVDLALRLGIDTKKAEQGVRGSLSLPHGTGREVRVIAFADDPAVIQACLAAGAVKAGAEDLVEQINGGWLDFDVAISTPKLMRIVGKLGRVLGPRGLMPAPKSGTVTEDVASAVREFKGGKVEFRADAAGNVHLRIGTVAFAPEQLVDNAKAVLKHIAEAKPAGLKGEFIRSVTISSTMGPGVRLAL